MRSAGSVPARFDISGGHRRLGGAKSWGYKVADGQAVVAEQEKVA
jgi:hypothetical protein